MQEIYAYNLLPSVINELQADKLVLVSWISRKSKDDEWGSLVRPDIGRPGTLYFNNLEAVNTEGGYHLCRGKSKLRFVESMPGGEWRMYNRYKKEDATKCLIFAVGNPDSDFFHVNPGVRIEVKDGVVVCHNISLMNGVLWSDVQTNKTIKSVGADWYFRGIHDGSYSGGGYLAAERKYDKWGTSRPSWIKISERTDIPLTKDFKGDTDLEELNTDYIFTEHDKNDPDVEVLVLLLAYDQKKRTRRFTIPILDYLLEADDETRS